VIAKLDLEPGNDDDACREVGHDLRRFLDRGQSHTQLHNLDLLTWSRRFLPHYFPLPPSAMHLWLATHLDRISILPRPMGEGRGEGAELRVSNFELPSNFECRDSNLCPLHLNLLAPRGSAKSTVVTVSFVLHEALFSNHPYIWIVSDTHHQAAAHLENIKTELLENEALREAYPGATGQGPIWRRGAIILNNRVMIEAFGTGQRIRGRRRRQFRPTLIICDDLENDSHISSALAREKTRSWFHGLLMKAGAPRTHVITLGTALHRECLTMQLTQTPGWTSHTFRAIQHWPDRMELWSHWEELYQTNSVDPDPARHFYDSHRREMEQGAALLWPQRENLYTLMCMRAESGYTAFDREKQSIPVNPDLCEWPEEYFGDHIWFDTWPADLRLNTLALDPSKGSDSRRGDYSAFVALALAADNLLYIEADLARRPTPQIVTDGVELVRRFRPQLFGIEANQFQHLLGADFLAEFKRQGFIGTAPCSIENTINKQVRIRRLGPLLAARRLRFKTNSPGTRLLVHQLREFPIAGHDDGPDALEMALRLAESLTQPVPNDGLGNRLV
jgi:predicted phage terminase large subunit-like protein